jgi:hypothetical protein
LPPPNRRRARRAAAGETTAWHKPRTNSHRTEPARACSGRASTAAETAVREKAQLHSSLQRLSLSREQVVQLGEYLDPATSAEIEPDSKGGLGETLAADVREVEAKVFAPTQRHEHPMNIWRRIAFFFRRLAGQM